MCKGCLYSDLEVVYLPKRKIISLTLGEEAVCSQNAQHGLCHTVQFVIADYSLADVESLPRVQNSK